MSIPFKNPIINEQMRSLVNTFDEIFAEFDTTYFQGEHYYYWNSEVEPYIHNYTNSFGEIVWLDTNDILTEAENKKKSSRKVSSKKTVTTNPDTRDKGFEVDLEIKLADTSKVVVHYFK